MTLDPTKLAGVRTDQMASRDHAPDTCAALDSSYQGRVADWMRQCFPPAVSEDRLERNDRFIEEALELAQSLGYSADRAHALVDYVFSRPVGEPHQEVGGVSVTLAALCNTAGLDLTDAAEDELERILQPEIILKIRAKQAAKPTGSALPIPSSATLTERDKSRDEQLLQAQSEATRWRDIVEQAATLLSRPDWTGQRDNVRTYLRSALSTQTQGGAK